MLRAGIHSLCAAAFALWASLAAAQGPNGVFLVAKPELADPNFSRTVVLVTQTEDFSTVGVIVNRPTTLKLAQFVADPGLDTGKYRDAVFLGGPVMRNALIAVFVSDAPPAAPAFHLLPKLYMTMHTDNVKMLLASEGRRYRLFAGFSGWAPRQLESEFDRAGWYVLPADTETVFRADTSGLWEELVERASALKTRHKIKGPAEGGAGFPGVTGSRCESSAGFLWRKATIPDTTLGAGSFGSAHFLTVARTLPGFPPISAWVSRAKV